MHAFGEMAGCHPSPQAITCPASLNGHHDENDEKCGVRGTKCEVRWEGKRIVQHSDSGSSSTRLLVGACWQSVRFLRSGCFLSYFETSNDKCRERRSLESPRCD